MQFFINEYPTKNSSIFYELIESIDPKNILAIGQEGNNGFIVKVDENGNLKWGKSYFIEGQRISFYRFVQASKNEYILLGRFHVNGKRRANHLVMRVTKSGTPKWVKRIYTGKTRNNIGIAKIGRNEYAITCWYNTSGSSDKIELHKIKSNGTLNGSVLITLGSDDQVYSIFPLGNYIGLVGGTRAGNPWDGFLVLVDPKLNVSKSYLFNHPNGSSLEDIQFAHFSENPNALENGILLLGKSVTNNYSRSFLVKTQFIEKGIMINYALTFDVTKGKDYNRRMIQVGRDYFILGQKLGGDYSYVVKLNADLQIIWCKKFDIEQSYVLIDMKMKNQSELWFSGYSGTVNKYSPLLIKTDFDLTTCKTIDIKEVEITEFPMNLKEMETKPVSIDTSFEEYDVAVDKIDVTKVVKCPKTIDIADHNWLQSPYLYLQSAGSLGQDAAQGMLLRWFLLRNLGDTHLPKGDYAGNTQGFNKADDYVCIYRTKYDTKIQQKLDFQTKIPISIDATIRKWVYKIAEQVYYLHFLDDQKYTTVLASINPASNPSGFLSSYGNGLLELELRENLAFSIEAEFADNLPDNALKIETMSVQGNIPLSETMVSSRKSFSQNNNVRIVAENIHKIVFQVTSGVLKTFLFEFYSDFLNDKTGETGWTSLGKFALSKDTSEVFLRLEDTSRFTVNSHWQKYNENAYVNVQNYKDRWSLPTDGMLAGVDKYIQLSNSDPTATINLSEEIDGGADMDMSYLSMLQIASMDFHIARMLGLGYVDTPSNSESDQFIYLAEYTTHGELDDNATPITRQHLYLTIPTALQDERPPQSLETLPVTYGVNLYNGTSQPFQITDPNGYVPYAPIRYINIRSKIKNDFSNYSGFFQPSLEFSLIDFSSPVFAGMEYRKQGEINWRKPEISHDPIYKDASADQNFETIPIPFNEDSVKPLFTHKEIEEGIHEYAVFGINIFSRASQFDNTVFTDFTKFIKPNTLIPPHNLQVQLIQEESPLVLTSQMEQDMLSSIITSIIIPNDDKTLVRLCFLYTHLHDINYGFGNKVEIFFREELPRNIMGGIGSIQDDTNDKYSIINTQPYTYNSTGETLIPNINPTLINNFKGGVLIIGQNRFHIEDIFSTNSNGDFPKFKIKKQEDRNTTDLGGGNIVTTQSFLPPSAVNGDLFMVIENMAKAESWSNNNPLGFHVEIGDASWTDKTESFVNEENDTLVHDLRGVWDHVKITPKTVNVNNEPLPPGYYDVVFNNYKLEHHSQYKDFNIDPHADSVEWYKGIIRISKKDDTGDTFEKKVLDVVTIENIGNNNKLKLVIHDDNYFIDILEDGKNIKTGTGLEVNFYPGYRVHLRSDNSRGFNESNILPQVGEGAKKTLIGLRTVDTTTQDAGSLDYHSLIGVPQILFALEIITPVPPQLPTGPLYATPPDFYGRSTYSFTTEFTAQTFGAIFYRADVNSILKTLYTLSTIEIIKNNLPPIEEDEYYTDRIKDLVGFSYSGGSFSEFPSGGYSLPIPDNTDNGFDGTSIDVALMKKVIWNVFLPLTEQPLIFSYIKGGDYVPIPKKQTIRDKYGKLLNPTASEYDQAPMAKKIDGTNKVLFTDFTLDGEMSKETTYLYCVREMGNRMSLSDPSLILGPIQLINTNPPEIPVIRKITTQLANVVTGIPTAVNFEINEYSASQNIKKIHIYRAGQAVDAMTPRTMDLVKEIDISSATISNGIIFLQDDFQFDSFLPPYGDPLFYKIVALREINYVDFDGNDIVDYVPSKPSKTLLTNIVDVINPEPPQIVESSISISAIEIIGLELKWNKTAYNAKYFLFKMNSVGNWNKLYEIQSNDEADLVYLFSDPIPKQDDGNVIYHRFKVTVENSSGLLNLRENIITL